MQSIDFLRLDEDCIVKMHRWESHSPHPLHGCFATFRTTFCDPPITKYLYFSRLEISNSLIVAHCCGSTITRKGTTVAWGLIFIFFLRFWTWRLWGSLISSGCRLVSGSIGGLFTSIMGNVNICPFLTNFDLIICRLMVFCSPPNQSSPPGVTRSCPGTSSLSPRAKLLVSS